MIENQTFQEKPQHSNWLGRLKQGLSKTSTALGMALGLGAKVDEALYEELESALLMADCGMAATQSMMKALKLAVFEAKADTVQGVRACLQAILTQHLQVLETELSWQSVSPFVVLVAGVNGAGKTTSIGKLAHWFAGQKSGQKNEIADNDNQNAKVLLAAGDTFRAAAREQLTVWGERNGVTVLSQASADPASIVFDAIAAARARGADVLLADTAGRLPTQGHLMDELKKVHRTAGKAMDGAPHGVWLVLDGNTGQNAVMQLKTFAAAIPVTGLIMTKLDGTAKGGVLAAIAQTCPVPVLFIGVGEGMQDLQPFRAAEFAQAMLAV